MYGDVVNLKNEILADKSTVMFIELIGGGPLAVEIIKLFNKNSLSPEQISKKLHEKITNVRSTLNSLHYRGVACYRKERDATNMYQFYWDIKYKKIVELMLEKLAEELKDVNGAVYNCETHDYFACPKNCGELLFEIAAAYDFKCPNCNSKLNVINSKAKIDLLKKKKKKIGSMIDKLDGLIDKMKDNTKGYVCE